MANSVTRLQLATGARLYADERPSGTAVFVTDTELNTLVNMACRELYDLLVSLSGDERYETEDTSITTTSSATYSLPATFYRLLSVHLRWSSTSYEQVRKLVNVNDRDRYYSHGSWAENSQKAYRLRGELLEFFPTPTSSAPATVVLRYVPSFTDLAADGTTINDVNGWSKLVMLRVACELRAINDLPMGQLKELYERELERITTLAAERSTSEPAMIRDVQPEETGNNWWWGPVT